MEKLITDGFKECYDCKKTKKTNKHNFSIDRSTKDNWCNYCKECRQASTKARYWKEKGKMPIRAVEKIRCSSCVFNRECRNNIWIKDWWPYCFMESKLYDLFVREYG